MEVKERKFLVFGSGISGIGAAKLLAQHGAQVVLYDGNEKLDKAGLLSSLGGGPKTSVVLGSFPEDLLDGLDMVILSPGVPTDLPVVEEMRKRGIQVIGEVELAYAFGKGDVLAITGTNGKTTTTSLLGEIMKNYQDDVYIVGNIGNPYTAVAGQMNENTITVAEMSSFQLESIVDFRPKVSAILNFTPDHLNRHHTMEAYVNAKKNIARNQGPQDYCILNYEDGLTREFGKKVKACFRARMLSRISSLPTLVPALCASLSMFFTSIKAKSMYCITSRNFSLGKCALVSMAVWMPSL